MTVEISSSLLTWAMRYVHISTRVPDGSFQLWERCGILRGRGDRITKLDLTENVALDPEHTFEIDPRALIDAYKRERKPRALTIMGFFHTHLSGFPTPSPTDAAMATPDGKLWLIAAPGRVALWRAVTNGPIYGRFERVRIAPVVGTRVEKPVDFIQHVDVGREFTITFEPEFTESN